MQAHTAAVITRALADVLEVEQVMYRALDKVLELHRRSDHTRAVGFPRADRAEHYCVADQQPWPCPTDVAVTAALAGVEGEG